MAGHSFRLPQPDRDGTTAVPCKCGDFALTYRWGGHGDAVLAAGDHIRHAALAEPIEAPEMDGTVIVLEGVSL